MPGCSCISWYLSIDTPVLVIRREVTRHEVFLEADARGKQEIDTRWQVNLALVLPDGLAWEARLWNVLLGVKFLSTRSRS